MSLQLAAQHLSSQGRGKDSTLVHMSPREVKGLNDLAMAHGGQLTINPQTGLPEAGFLESILPMVAGAGLMAVSGGAINPMTAGLITGGLSYAMTGSLKKGLMAGLGAYGGANLGVGLGETAVTMDPGVVEAQNAIMENAKTNFYQPASGLSEADFATQFATKNEGLAKSLMDARATAAGPDTFMGNLQQMGKGIGSLGEKGGFSSLYQNLGGSPMSLISKIGPALAPAAGELMKPEKQEETKGDSDLGQRYKFDMNPTSDQSRSLGGGQTQQAQPGQNPLGNTQTPTTTPFPTPDIYGREQRYFSPSYSKLTPDQAKSTYGYAEGGIADEDRPTETPALQAFKQMQAQRAAQAQAPQIDANAQFNQYAQQTLGAPNQMQAPTMPAPTSTSLASSGYSYDPIKQQYGQIQGTLKDEKEKEMASGGISHLGDYSDGGRLLRGPGDGVSDSIPAMIGKRQPARLADGEFVVPARIVSELGNGSTEAGARKLYAMMDRIQKARGKTVGKGKVAKNSRSDKYLPA
jgi:hypothetical protein